MLGNPCRASMKMTARHDTKTRPTNVENAQWNDSASNPLSQNGVHSHLHSDVLGRHRFITLTNKQIIIIH